MRKAVPLLVLVLLLAGAAALALIARDNGHDDRTVIGNKGLELWLQAHDIPVVGPATAARLPASGLSLRILPMRAPPEEAPATRSRKTEPPSDPASANLAGKLLELPTLVILPKWSAAILRNGLAQGASLAPPAAIYGQLGKLDLSRLRLRRLGPGFTEAQFSAASGGAAVDSQSRATLYRAQLFDRATLPAHCDELAGAAAGALLLRCEDEASFYLLSDPDALNNHGLSQGDNAAFALALVRRLRDRDEARPVYLDTGGPLLDGDSDGTADEGRSYERSAAEFGRLLSWPLSMIWSAILLVAALCLWRGAYRFGPPLRSGDAAMEISKTTAVEATARLLRLSGNDGRMAAQFVHNLLADRAAARFGPGAATDAGIDRLFGQFARRDAAAAQALRAVASALTERGPTMSRQDLHNNLNRFRTLLGSMDFGP
ncbi:hypothetical protein ACERNI_13560 [Camelimonas sp. ID_303_24]